MNRKVDKFQQNPIQDINSIIDDRVGSQLNFTLISRLFIVKFIILDDLECDDDIEDDTSHYDDDDDDEEDVYNDRDEGEDDDDDEDEEDDDDEEIDDDEEEDEEQVEEVNNSWSDACPELIPLEFEGVIGPTFERLRSPLDYFRKLFSEDLFDLLLRETIKYAQRTKPNFTLNIVELEGFLGVTMIMSMIRVPSIEDYWSHDDWFGQKQVKSVFVRRRYRQILSALHLVDKDSQTCIRSSPEYDRLHNTRPMINILKNNFRDSFSLGCRLSFDEFMIKFKGNFGKNRIFINRNNKKIKKKVDQVSNSINH